MTQTLYGAQKSALSDLYTIDPATAVMTSVGPIGSGMSGLACDPTTGELYGCSSGASAFTASLYLIDTTTGAGTLLGTFPGSNQMHDIAFDASGQLWGIDTCGNLWQLDKTDASGTNIGPGGCSQYSGGFDIDSGGTFWRVGNKDPANPTVPETATMDSSTGVLTHVAVTSDGNYLHSGKFDQFGVFWASSPGQTSSATELVTIDQTTGVVTPVAAFSVSTSMGPIAWAGTPTPVLTVKFTASPVAGQPTLSVSFTDESTPGPSGPITAWNWDFGDGGNSTSQNPTHNYTTPGRYTVTLTVTGTSPDGTASLIKAHYIYVYTGILYAAKKDATSDLYTVDPTTAVLTSVGPIGSGMSGLAYDVDAGVLYGTTSGASADAESLYTIDTTTGAGTLVGASGGFGVQVHDIAFDSDGQLWGVDTNGFLVSIDKATGILTYVGSGTNGSYSGGFDINPEGVGWRVGNRTPTGGHAPETAHIDLTTGIVTHIAAMSDGNFLDAGKFDPAGSVFWASSPGQGTPLNLVTVDPPSGTVTLVAAFSETNVSGLAWALTSVVPDFSVALVPNTITIPSTVSTLVHLNTTAHHGDTETITLSATAPAGFTVTFPDNPITAGDVDVPIDVSASGVGVGTYTITIHCNGTDNSHDVTLTVHVVTTVPGFHIAS